MTSDVAPPAGAGLSTDRPRPRRGSLSPSRAADFKQCPLLFRFRTVDRLPEAPSSAAVRGTVVHRVLERLFDLPAERRTVEAARELVRPSLDDVLAERPEVATLFAALADTVTGPSDAVPSDTAPSDTAPSDTAPSDTASPGPMPPGVMPAEHELVTDLPGWLADVARLVEHWFALEDPTRLEPAGRELLVEHQLEGGPLLRGVVDRLDEAPDGRLRVVDYKTGQAPGEPFEARALFQMKFYALLLWRTRGRVPSRVQLVYVGGRGEVLPLDVDADMLAAFERTLLSLWQAIGTAARTGDWRARRSRLCDWCAHRARCPQWGGEPPPLPEDAAQRVLGGGTPEAPGLDEH